MYAVVAMVTYHLYIFLRQMYSYRLSKTFLRYYVCPIKKKIPYNFLSEKNRIIDILLLIAVHSYGSNAAIYFVFM